MNSSADNHTLIDDNVYYGSIDVCLNKDKLRALGIKRVLSITERSLKKSEQERGVYYRKVPLNDSVSPGLLAANLEDVVNRIIESQKYDENILIHGLPNQSVSAVMAVAFLMKKREITTEEAVKTVTQDVKICQQLYSKFRQCLDVWKRSEYRLNAREPTFRQMWLKELIEDIGRNVFSHNEFDFPLLHLFYDHVYRFEFMLWYLCQNESKHTSKTRVKVYYCRKCNRDLFADYMTIENRVSKDKPNACDFVYAEPQLWTVRQSAANALKFYNKKRLLIGDIECLDCGLKVGDYDWSRLSACKCALHKGLHFLLIYRFRRPLITSKYFNSSEV